VNWLSRESGAFAWLVLVVLVTAYVTAYDVWAYMSGHRMMTTQFRDWLHETVAGPIIAGLWIGVFVALTFHFLVKGRS
jgi:hypothetical protein